MVTDIVPMAKFQWPDEVRFALSRIAEGSLLYSFSVVSKDKSESSLSDVGEAVQGSPVLVIGGGMFTNATEAFSHAMLANMRQVAQDSQLHKDSRRYVSSSISLLRDPANPLGWNSSHNFEKNAAVFSAGERDWNVGLHWGPPVLKSLIPGSAAAQLQSVQIDPNIPT